MSDKQRAKRLWDFYGLTVEEWETIHDFQSKVCFICGRPNKKKQRLAMDHCHKTGLIRGLLCSQCNRVLGKVESPRWQWGIEQIRRAVFYLENPPAVIALGKQVFGYAGRVGTKKHRAELRRKKKIVTPSIPLLRETK